MSDRSFSPASLRLPAILAVAVLFSGLAFADDAYDRCIDASDGTNMAWGACGGAWIEREDKALNETWAKVHGAMTGQSRTDLLTEQRAWIAFKETSCQFYANGDYGREGQVLSFPSCRAQVIADRTAALKGYGEGQ